MRTLLVTLTAAVFLLLGNMTGFFTVPSTTVTATLLYPAEHWAGNETEEETMVRWNHPVTGEPMIGRTSWSVLGKVTIPSLPGDTLPVEVDPTTGELVGSTALLLIALGAATGIILSTFAGKFRMRRVTRMKPNRVISVLKDNFVG